jgi:hypothetical protein
MSNCSRTGDLVLNLLFVCFYISLDFQQLEKFKSLCKELESQVTDLEQISSFEQETKLKHAATELVKS